MISLIIVTARALEIIVVAITTITLLLLHF